MATSTLVPLEEYLQTSYKPEMEYVEGQLVERHVGEYDHSILQALLATLLNQRRRERQFRVFTEQRVLLSGVPGTKRYRIPDVCVKALPHPHDPVITCPDLVIEILSREDEPADILAKIADYLGAGIPHIWIVDPAKRRVLDVGATGIRVMPDRIVETDLVGPVDFDSLFNELDEPTD